MFAKNKMVFFVRLSVVKAYVRIIQQYGRNNMKKSLSVIGLNGERIK